MSSPRIRDLIEDFATKLQDVLKEDLQSALESFGTASAGSRTNGAGRRAASVPAANGHIAAKRARSKGAKRDPADLEVLAARFVDFVSKHPGLRIEQINKQLGTTTKDLALPIRKLVADGTLKTHGQKRSTTYTVAGGKRRKK